MNNIKPEIDLAHILPKVQMPGRYTGGEYGIVSETRPGDLLTAICFPDLYEIGMSNTAIKLLYAQLNSMDNVHCERVFTPAPDFEESLRQSGIPLYTLESGIPLQELDMLGFSVGYELSATNILSTLERGHIPIRRGDRSSTDPIVLGGGPALTNPEPFAEFFDAIYIGEAEESLYSIVQIIRTCKAKGAPRQDILKELQAVPAVWMPEKEQPARRVLWHGFDTPRTRILPVPNISVVQDHAVVEIMRGCPNGCRFCHAGYFYRPYRQKSAAAIIEEIDFYVYELGYREITLSSLSSGDYVGLHQLVRTLNARYQGLGVSFALPSLHVNSFTLPLLQEVSKIRKSGLTFAVETPHQEWQRSINKEVTAEKVNEILLEARRRGWNLAKFYFMVGLPEHLYEGANEAEAIIEYLQQVRKVSKFKLNVNIGTFIPKPHTPYQWSRQLTEEQALERIKEVREAFHKTAVRVNYHSPFISYLEGVISRGDSRVGPLIEDAYRRGARLDAWEEHVSFDIWRAAIESQNWNVEKESCRERDTDEELPWKKVDIGVTQRFLKSELEKSKQHELTNACVFPCDHHCGVCVQETRPLAAAEQNQDDESAESPIIETEIEEEAAVKKPEADGFWYLFSFSKQGKARYLSHINIMTIFERSFQRAGIGLEYTSGFNPKPRMEFAHPLTLGIASKAEIARCKLIAVHEAAEVISSMNRALPEGIQITQLQQMPGQKGRGRGQSLMALHAASTYLIKGLPESKYTQNSVSGNTNSGIEELSEKINNFLEDKKADKNLLEIDSEKENIGTEVFSIKLHIPTQGVGKFNLKELCTYTHGTIGEFLSSFSVEREQLLMEPPEAYGEVAGSLFDYFRLVQGYS